MSGEAATATLALQAVQALLTLFESYLLFGAFLCPTDTTIEIINSTSFDYVIIGGGSSGLVLANRLSACTDANVLVLEAGGCPPLEANCMGYFTLQPQSAYDYNMTSVNDGYAGQNLQNSEIGLTAGKMLGGSNSLHHNIWVRGAIPDYEAWATAADDSSWSYEGLLSYFIKSESVLDTLILTENGTYHGTSGPTKVVRPSNSSATDLMMKVLAENTGFSILNNINADIANGVVLPLLQLDNSTASLREGGHKSYLYPIKGRSNLYVLTGATVSKINFDSDNVATGVTFTYSDTSYTVNANSEVILAAGALITPQLLMLSGVGPSAHLEEKNITVVSDLSEVGQNLQDHVAASLMIALDEDSSTAPTTSPFEFPVPVVCSYANYDNSSATYAQAQNIALYFYHDSSGLAQLCSNVFKYTDTICDAMIAANTGRNLMWNVINVLHPDSRGSVLLDTTDISDQPLVTLGLLSDSTDLDNLALFVSNYAAMVNTSSYESLGAEVLDLGLCTDETLYSTEYWQCYALAMSSTMWHYSGTAAIGTVVDANLLVKGVSNLRVVDASVFPTVPGGNINAAVIAVAEKAADIIVSGRSTCTAE